MANDLAALDDLLADADWMRGLARRLLGDRDEADDVVQEAWLNALRVPPTGAARGRTLRPWMATVILNLVRSRVRRGARTRARDQLYGQPDPAPAAEELLAQRQTERRLAQLVLTLEEPYRRTILLRFHDGQSSAAIARAEGIPEGTVRWRLKYGLDQLRRRFGKNDDGATTALGALLPIAGLPTGGPPVVPAVAPIAPVSTASPWLGQAAALVQGKAVLTAAGAVAAVALVTAGVRQLPPRANSPGLAPRTATTALAMTAPARPTVPTGPAVPAALLDAPSPAPSDSPSAAAPVAPASATLTAITGIVRDSRGEAAARVPVTLRTSSGSGAADRITTTDAAGRFSYQIQPQRSFVLTAELQGEPAARVEIEAPAKMALSLDAAAALTSVASFATIDVALDPSPRRSVARPAKPRPALGAPLSRWCCRNAFLEGDLVYGRACLRFDDSSNSQQSGCELYGLKAQVSCHHYTQGGVSTGDLSRTDRLACDGRLL